MHCSQKRTAYGWALPCAILTRATQGHSVPNVDIERMRAPNASPTMSHTQDSVLMQFTRHEEVIHSHSGDISVPEKNTGLLDCCEYNSLGVLPISTDDVFPGDVRSLIGSASRGILPMHGWCHRCSFDLARQRAIWKASLKLPSPLNSGTARPIHRKEWRGIALFHEKVTCSKRFRMTLYGSIINKEIPK
eukprot:9466914-Pyramimonas_sp.AAC.1